MTFDELDEVLTSGTAESKSAALRGLDRAALSEAAVLERVAGALDDRSSHEVPAWDYVGPSHYTEFKVAEEAARALVKGQAAALPHLRAALADRRQRRALDVVTHIASSADITPAEVELTLQTLEGVAGAERCRYLLRVRQLRAEGTLDGAEGLKLLAAALEGSDNLVKQAAIRTLGTLTSESAVALAVRAHRDHNAGASPLDAMGVTLVGHALDSFFSGVGERVYGHAEARVLGRQRDPRALPPLLATLALGNDDGRRGLLAQFCAAALAALGEVSLPVRPQLLEWLHEGDIALSARAFVALGESGGLSADERSHYIEEACRGIGEHGNGRVYVHHERLVRLAATEAIPLLEVARERHRSSRQIRRLLDDLRRLP